MVEETILNKLTKIKELVLRGEEGEAIAAKRKLETLLKTYGISWDEFFAKEETSRPRVFKYSSKEEKQLLVQCAFNCFGSDSLEGKFYRYKNGKMEFTLELTEAEYILFKDFYNFHLKEWREYISKQIEKSFYAYIERYQLYDSTPSKQNNKSSKPKFSWSEISEIMNMANNLEKKSYRRKLNA